MENGLRGAGVAACFLLCSMDASLAFSSPLSCDLVALRAADSGDARMGEAAWMTYRNELLQILRTAREQRAIESELAEEVIGRQKAAVESVPAAALAAYRRSPTCTVLGKLEPHALAALDDTAALDPRFAPAAAQLRHLAKAALRHLDHMSRMRFRSAEHRKLFEAGYYCFVASLVYSASSPARQRASTLQSFGPTIECTDLKRTE